MPPVKSGLQGNTANPCAFAQRVFFNHTVDVLFPHFNTLLCIVEDGAGLFYKRFPAVRIAAQIHLVAAFFAVFDKMCRLAVRTAGDFLRFDYFLYFDIVGNGSQKLLLIAVRKILEQLFQNVQFSCDIRYEEIPYNSNCYDGFCQIGMNLSTYCQNTAKNI